MTSTAEDLRASEDEYIARERESETKSELVNGLIVAMAGGSPKHNAIAGNVLGALRSLLKTKPCIAFPSDQRVHIEATGMYAYPDVTVACGQPRFHPKFNDTLVNPKLLVEVLSPSTEAYDRGAKFAHYRTIPSLAEILFVSQDERCVEHYQRLESGQWLLTEYKGDEAIVSLPALECALPLSEIYEKTELLDQPVSD